MTREEIETVRAEDRERRRTERSRKVRGFWQRKRDEARAKQSGEPYREAEQAGQLGLFGGGRG